MSVKIITLMDLWDEIVDEAAREILEFTPQIFRKEDYEVDNVKPKPLATGILINVEQDYFLVTACHILTKAKPEDIGIMIDDTFCILNGEIVQAKDVKDCKNDKIDIAITKLDKNVVETILKGYTFLTLNKIDYAHTVITEPRYLIVGFPGTRTRIKKHTQKIIPDPFIYLTKEADKKVYGKLGFEEHSNMIAVYRRRKTKTFGSPYVNFGPDPHGISGCGLWYLQIPSLGNLVKEHKNVSYKLVGMMTEYRQERNVVIATRIHIITEILRTHFKANIPGSNITRLA